MTVKRGRSDKQRRTPIGDRCGDSHKRFRVFGKEQLGESLVGVPPKNCVVSRDTEAGQGCERLFSAARPPANTVSRGDVPPALDSPLGPRVIVAVSGKNYLHGRAGGHRLLKEPASG